MKYTNTSKVLSLVFHGLMTLGFGAMGIYFAFFVVPFAFTTNPYQFSSGLFQASYYLYLELAVVGIAFFLISGFGTYKALMSISGGKDSDEAVRTSLTCFITEGWIGAITLFLDGSVLFDAMKGSANAEITFPIVMCVLVSIVLLIATNIPMVRMYDGRDYSPLLKSLLLGGAIVMITLALDSLFSLIGLTARSWDAKTMPFLYQLIAIVIPAAIAGGLLLAGGILLPKKEASPKKMQLGTILLGASMIIVSVTFLTHASLEFVWQADYRYHLIGLLNVENGFQYPGLGYGIMSVIAAAFLIGGGVAAILFSGKGEKKPGPRHQA